MLLGLLSSLIFSERGTSLELLLASLMVLVPPADSCWFSWGLTNPARSCHHCWSVNWIADIYVHEVFASESSCCCWPINGPADFLTTLMGFVPKNHFWTGPFPCILSLPQPLVGRVKHVRTIIKSKVEKNLSLHVSLFLSCPPSQPFLLVYLHSFVSVPIFRNYQGPLVGTLCSVSVICTIFSVPLFQSLHN